MSAILLPVASFLKTLKARRIHLVATSLLITCAAQIHAQFDTAIVPHHYIVVYRNATVPGDASTHTHAAGARMLQRHDRFGLAVVESADAANHDGGNHDRH